MDRDGFWESFGYSTARNGGDPEPIFGEGGEKTETKKFRYNEREINEKAVFISAQYKDEPQYEEAIELLNKQPMIGADRCYNYSPAEIIAILRDGIAEEEPAPKVAPSTSNSKAEKGTLLVFHKDKMWCHRPPAKPRFILFQDEFYAEMQAEFVSEIPTGYEEIKMVGFETVSSLDVRDIVRFEDGRRGLGGSYFDQEEEEWVKAIPNKFSKNQPKAGEFWSVKRSRSIGRKITVVDLIEKVPSVFGYYLSALTPNDLYGFLWKKFYPY